MAQNDYNKRYARNLQRLKRLRLFDDDFMTRCFEGSPQCVELLLHVILEKLDLRVLEVHVQYSIKNLQGRSARLDILAVDSTGKRYNIEVQRNDEGAGVKRARYHSGLLDTNLLLAGDDPENLPEIYVIFITEHDVIGYHKPVYHIDRTIRETGTPFGDGSHIIYVNGAWRDDSPIGMLMQDFCCTDPEEMHYEVLADRVRYFKEDKEGIHTMCKIWEEVLEEGVEKGVKIGRKEGAQENLVQNLKLLALQMSVDQAMDLLHIPAEERDALRAAMQ